MEHYSFAKLIDPITPERFFAEFWEKKPLIVHRNQSDYYRDLLTIDGVNDVLTTLSHQNDEVFMGNHDSRVAPSEYTYESGLVDVARLYANFAAGSSIALNNLHDRVASLGGLVRSFEKELSSRFQTNVYFSPGDAQCFPPHFDSHCVFALQTEGKKAWRLYETPVELPHHSRRFDPNKDGVGEVTEEFVLEAGDLVYVPRGMGHAADTKGLAEPSLHVTVGVLQHNWSDLFLEALARVSIDDAKLRAGLPIGFARPDFDRDQARAIYKEMLNHLAEKMDFDRAMDFFVDDIISTRHPVLPGQYEQVMKAQKLESVEAVASRRPNVLFRLEESEGEIKVHAYGSAVKMPIHAAEPLRFALMNDNYKIADLPGDLDDAGKLVLIRRLVREGLVMLR